MKTPSSTSAAGTRARLLAGAARVFARHGLAGATTRAIAREAGVNEVTLFRHFGSKERLLAAVVGENFGAEPGRGREGAARPATADLRADLTRLAGEYDRLLTANLPLVRTMLGEIHHHHRDQERQVFRAVFQPVKSALAGRIAAAQQAGGLRADVGPELLADLFTGMLFTGVIRRAARDLNLNYDARAHLRAAVELVLRGAAAKGKGSRK
jgi:AcrR family transcriptional regulator